jgi:hypothetical protein
MNNKILIIAVILASIVAAAVIFASIFMEVKMQTSFAISSVSPQNESRNISLSPHIFIAFSRPLTETEKKTVSVTMFPQVDSIVSWEDINNSAVVNLKGALSPDVNYLITVNYGGRSFSWNFKTQNLIPSFTPTPSDDPLLDQQGQSDLKFAQSQEEFLKSHPWYDNLPPENDQYFINYDDTKNDFFVNLYPKINSSSTEGAQVSQFKKTVLQVLQSLGVNTSSYQIEWIIIPR